VRDLAVLFLHLLTTVARLVGPGGARSVVAESVLVKHQLLILNRSRKRSPNLRFSDRMVAGLCALLMRPGRLIRFRDHPQALNALEPSSNADPAEIPAALLVHGADGAGLTPVFLADQIAPGGATFQDFGSPIINAHGQVAAGALLTNSAGGSGLFLGDGTNAVAIALLGQPAPRGGN
jgi:hypothetical protein